MLVSEGMLPRNQFQATKRLLSFFSKQKNSSAALLRPIAIKKHSIVGVLGAKGGVGSSTIALNLATAWGLSRRTSDLVTLLDANFQQPDLTLMVGATNNNSLSDILARESTLDERVFKACLAMLDGTDNRVGLLSSPLTGQALADWKLSVLTRCLVKIQKYSDLWIIDLPKNLDGELVSLLDVCDCFVIVMEPTLVCTADCKRWFEFLLDLGYNMNNSFLVLNRVDSRVLNNQFTTSITQLFPKTDLVRVPNMFEKSQALAQTPHVQAFPKGNFAQAIAEICRRVEKQLVVGDESSG